MKLWSHTVLLSRNLYSRKSLVSDVFTVFIDVHRFLFAHFHFVKILHHEIPCSALHAEVVLHSYVVVCHTKSQNLAWSSLCLTCMVVLMLVPALRSTLTTLDWPSWDAIIRAVAPSCEGRWRELPT